MTYKNLWMLHKLVFFAKKKLPCNRAALMNDISMG